MLIGNTGCNQIMGRWIVVWSAQLGSPNFVNDHTTSKILVLVRSPKSSDVGRGQYLDGWPLGNTACCWHLNFLSQIQMFSQIHLSYLPPQSNFFLQQDIMSERHSHLECNLFVNYFYFWFKFQDTSITGSIPTLWLWKMQNAPLIKCTTDMKYYWPN